MMLNSNEFVISCTDGQMFKYNVSRNKWTLFLKLPDFVKYLGPHPDMLIDEPNNRIFLTGGLNNGDTTLVLDLRNGSLLNTFQYKSDLEFMQKCYEDIQKCWDNQWKGKVDLIKVNGIVHKMGGHDDGCPDGHVTWNEAEQNWTPNAVIEPFSKMFEDSPQVQISLVHVLTKGMLLLFGSFRDGESDCVGIWRYIIEANKWEEIRNYLGKTVRNAVLTSDQQFVILSCVDPINEGKEKPQSILVVDIRDDNLYSFWMSSLKIPRSSAYRVMRSGGDGGGEGSALLVSGWIRQLFANQEYREMSVPSVVVNIISQWSPMPETIHWIADKGDLAICKKS